jgi:hypothetical protein
MVWLQDFIYSFHKLSRFSVIQKKVMRQQAKIAILHPILHIHDFLLLAAAPFV